MGCFHYTNKNRDSTLIASSSPPFIDKGRRFMAMTLKDKTVFITGASSGIGYACAEAFAAKGCRLLLTARRGERLEALALSLREKYGTHCLVAELDVQQKKAIDALVQSIPPSYADIDILLNNAGLSLDKSPLQDNNPAHWDAMIQTNVMGLLHMTHALLPKMLERQKGHVINMGSVAGRQTYAGGTVYTATKHAVRAISQGLKHDLLGTPIRVTCIEPGMVNTEFSTVRFEGDIEKANAVYEGATPLSAKDIAEAVIFAATRPLHVNISDMLILATDQSDATTIFRQGDVS
jgi:3-hydroxy acid dehydrogenase/malonic semialdehyde reductase